MSAFDHVVLVGVRYNKITAYVIHFRSYAHAQEVRIWISLGLRSLKAILTNEHTKMSRRTSSKFDAHEI